MENLVKIGKKIFIRNAGKNEYWLQDIIYENPKILGLGDLIAVNKEKKQSSGGRLDILLKEPTENIMYEVEVMLGETDPSHIIRSIEYWDNEKRKYPQRQHFCVLIAESFDRRYFNIIHLMSLNIPMIAIQADLLEVNGEQILNFSKIIDIYVEPEENEEDLKQVNESNWNNDSPWTNDNAKELFNILKEKHDRINIRYTQSYISINIDSKKSYWFYKRSKPNSALLFSVRDDEKAEAIKKELEVKEVEYIYNNQKDFMLSINLESLKEHIELINKIDKIRSRKLTDNE